MRSTARIGFVAIVFACVAEPPPLRGAPSLRTEPPRAPVVAGSRAESLTAADRGMILVRELGCIHCHGEAADIALALDSRRGPDLGSAGARVRTEYLERFILNPAAVDPGTTMPAVLHALPSGDRSAAAAALAEYVRSLVVPVPPAVESEPTAADVEQGRLLYHRIGCVACHAPRDESGRERSLEGVEPLPDLAAKYSAASLRQFLLDPASARPESRMPNFRLTPSEAHEIASYLQASPAEAARERGASELAAVRPLDPERVARGRELFATLGCAACHDARAGAPQRMQGVPSLTRDAKLDAGCLAETPGFAPHYGLDAAQRAAIVVALSDPIAPETANQRVQRAIHARGCTACHARDESLGIDPARNDYFTTNDPSLGEHGRVPPSLTLVGAKLQTEWLTESIAYGQSIRPYLNTRMPGFGAEFGARLAADLAATDALPPLGLSESPADDAQRETARKLGCELVGENAMNCIMCHSFAGERVGPVGAVDLIESTGQRLRREWFHHFLLKPSSVSPGTLMPEYYVDGISTRPDVGGGDAAQQIDAMWHYLAEGRNARKPPGLRQPPLELTVGDEAVLLRRSAQGSGKRAISVGYPGGVNLSFDAESLAVTRLWWGGFVDASGVFYGQGAGEARPLGGRIATLPKGPVFARLESEHAPWPIASRRDLGGRWIGYDLDEQQRPTFRYVCEGVTITDTILPFDDLPRVAPPGLAAPRPARRVLRRMLEFVREGGTGRDSDTTFQFLVARDPHIVHGAEGEVLVGNFLSSPRGQLRICLPPGRYSIRDGDRGCELIAAVQLESDRANLTLEYSWRDVSHH